MKKSVFLLSVLLIVACCVFFVGCTNKAVPAGSSTDDSKTEQDVTPSTQNDTNDSDETDNNDGESAEKTSSTVRFRNIDYSEISLQEISIGQDAVAPDLSFVPAQHFFVGWDHSLKAIREDIDIMPVYQSLSDVVNAIGFNTVYVKNGQEFDVDVQIAGRVEFASVELSATYDSESLTVLSVTSGNGYAAYYHDPDDHSVRFSFASASNVDGAMTLFRIHCRAKTTTSDTPLTISLMDISKLNQQGDILDGQYTLFNEKIIVL